MSRITDGVAIECAIDDLIRAAEQTVAAYETGRGFGAAERDLKDAKSSLLSLVDELRKDAARIEFLETGGFTAFRSSVNREHAWVTDCRDDSIRERTIDAPTLREAIDTAISEDSQP